MIFFSNTTNFSGFCSSTNSSFPQKLPLHTGLRPQLTIKPCLKLQEKTAWCLWQRQDMVFHIPQLQSKIPRTQRGTETSPYSQGQDIFLQFWLILFICVQIRVHKHFYRCIFQQNKKSWRPFLGFIAHIFSDQRRWCGTWHSDGVLHAAGKSRFCGTAHTSTKTCAERCGAKHKAWQFTQLKWNV